MILLWNKLSLHPLYACKYNVIRFSHFSHKNALTSDGAEIVGVATDFEKIWKFVNLKKLSKK